MRSVSGVSIPDPPFNPYELRPLASLNRRRFIPLPGIDPAWVGKTGGELCSAAALVQLIQAQAAELGLKAARAEVLPRRLNDLLLSPDPAVQSVAQAIAVTHGQRFGGLVASILRSPNGLSSPLVAWEAAYLRHWREEIEQIVLGGGLANGRLGEIIAAEAETMLMNCGIRQLSVRPARDPSILPLVGAARSLPGGDGRAAIVADFGSTWAKRGLGYYQASGELEKLLVFPPVLIAGQTEHGKASQLAQAMVAILADTIQQAGPKASLATDVMCSLAAYIIDGIPAPQSGARAEGYYGLHTISNDPRGWFSEHVRQASGRKVRFHFAHDAEAAAAALAGQAHTAVIMLGSALGVGFVPPSEFLRPIISDFHLEYL